MGGAKRCPKWGNKPSAKEKAKKGVTGEKGKERPKEKSQIGGSSKGPLTPGEKSQKKAKCAKQDTK